MLLSAHRLEVNEGMQMRRRGFTYLLSTTLLAVSIVGAIGMPPSARAAVDLRVCGKVTAYISATSVTPGVLTVGGIPLVIAAGTSLSSKVAVGANLCLALDLNLSGKVTDAAVTANVTSELNLCGVVSAYARADADTTGILTIGGRKLVLAIGSSLPAVVKIGSNLCLSLKLNGFGEVRGGTARVSATSTLRVCGEITAYAHATSTLTGLITVAGKKLILAVGSHLPTSVAIGKRLCLTFTLNAIGQVQDATVQADVQSALEACGQVTAFADATDASNGSLTFAGTRLSIRAGTDLSAQIRAGAFVRLRLWVDALGRIADATVLKDGTSLADACVAAARQSPVASAQPSAGDGALQSPSGSPAASPISSVLPGTVTNSGGSADGGDGAGGPASGQQGGGLVPDTASLARTASVIGMSAVPFLVMLAGIGASVGYRRRERARGQSGERA
jgi:hypothetical protein